MNSCAIIVQGMISLSGLHFSILFRGDWPPWSNVWVTFSIYSVYWCLCQRHLSKDVWMKRHFPRGSCPTLLLRLQVEQHKETSPCIPSILHKWGARWWSNHTHRFGCCVHGPRSSGHPNTQISVSLSRDLAVRSALSSESTSGKSSVQFFVNYYSSHGNKHDLNGGICSNTSIIQSRDT